MSVLRSEASLFSHKVKVKVLRLCSDLHPLHCRSQYTPSSLTSVLILHLSHATPAAAASSLFAGWTCQALSGFQHLYFSFAWNALLPANHMAPLTSPPSDLRHHSPREAFSNLFETTVLHPHPQHSSFPFPAIFFFVAFITTLHTICLTYFVYVCLFPLLQSVAFSI